MCNFGNGSWHYIVVFNECSGSHIPSVLIKDYNFKYTKKPKRYEHIMFSGIFGAFENV